MLRHAALVVVAIVASTACQEQLTQPASCPELCPGGTADVIEEVLTATPGGDSTFTGYALRGSGAVLLVSAGLPTAPDTDIAVVRFDPRADSVTVGTARVPYTIDSIALGVGIVQRDTTVRPASVLLYRLPSTIDTTSLTYAGVHALLTPSSLVATIPLPDTLVQGNVTAVLKGAALAPLTFGPADGNRLALAVVLQVPSPTGITIGVAESNFAPTFVTYVKPMVATPPTTSRAVLPTIEFNSWVSKLSGPPPPDLLSIGNAPSSRSLIRFPWPLRLRDSVAIVRATLELTPATPVVGLKPFPGNIQAFALVTDLGAKSPLQPLPGDTVIARLPPGSGTVTLEVGQLVRFWQGTIRRPPALFIAADPEAATFTQATFGSTRSGVPPKLRLSYLRSFPFERP
ncbi:MAG TPA: hypothetical protein VFW66_12565 [Gemmatimonadales bacterium]|nr:hypothetical protein [Gemmatimonadales bacterium]